MALQGFHRPRTVAEATALLAQDPDAKLLSGGATLVAMINARVIEPAALVSLAAIDEIQGISALPDGRLRIGAFTRHRDTAACAMALGANGVVRSAASQIASATVRNMGTIGGSIAFADPGLDYPPALVAARAEVEIAGRDGRRTVPARKFFVDWYTTALAPGEMVTAVLLPAAQRGGAGLYVKHARVSGDYATVSVAIEVENQSSSSQSVKVRTTIADANGMQVWRATGTAATALLPPGQYTVRFEARDKQGQAAFEVRAGESQKIEIGPG